MPDDTPNFSTVESPVESTHVTESTHCSQCQSLTIDSPAISGALFHDLNDISSCRAEALFSAPAQWVQEFINGRESEVYFALGVSVDTRGFPSTMQFPDPLPQLIVGTTGVAVMEKKPEGFSPVFVPKQIYSADYLIPFRVPRQYGDGSDKPLYDELVSTLASSVKQRGEYLVNDPDAFKKSHLKLIECVIDAHHRRNNES